VKCDICKTKKAQRQCIKLGKYLCSLCCGGGERDISCPPMCPHYKMHSQPGILIASPTITNEDTKERFPIPFDEYIPQVAMLIKCEVSEYSLSPIDSNTLKASFHCCLEECYPSIVDFLYLKEEWKKTQLQMALGNPEGDIAPISVINKDDGFLIYPEEIRILTPQGQEIRSIVDPTRNLIILPESVPRLAKPELAKDEYYVVYYGLNEILYAELKMLKEPFIIEFTIHNYNYNFQEGKFVWDIPIMFPFGKTSLTGFTEQSGLFELSEESCLTKLEPYKGKTIWGYEKIAAMFPVPEDLQNIRLRFGLESAPIGVKNLKSDTIDSDMVCFHSFKLKFSPKRESYIAVKLSRNPIPLALYDYLDAIKVLSLPIAVTFYTNANPNPARLIIQSEIEGITTAETQTIEVDAYQQISVKHQPKILSRTSLPVETLTANLKIIIQKVVGDTANLIYSQSFAVRLLAKDTMVWKSLLPNGISQRLGNYLACWVTPHAPEIDTLTSRAVHRMPKKAFIGYQASTALSVLEQVKAIYEELASIPLRYISRTISFGTNDYQSAQRVQWPSQTIVNSGNCIDLSLLIASALENIGINPIIVLVPGHAFVGWESDDKGKNLEFLEATVIDHCTFEQAVHLGRDRYNKEFNSREYRETQIMNIRKMREQGVFPMTN
jgi:hypothetical protein